MGTKVWIKKEMKEAEAAKAGYVWQDGWAFMEVEPVDAREHAMHDWRRCAVDAGPRAPDPADEVDDKPAKPKGGKQAAEVENLPGDVVVPGADLKK